MTVQLHSVQISDEKGKKDQQLCDCRQRKISIVHHEKSTDKTHDEKLKTEFANKNYSNNNSGSNSSNDEDIVAKVLGPFGKFQLRAILLIFLVKIPSSWFMACIIYTAPAPIHGEVFCKPPKDVQIKNQQEWVKISHPRKEEANDHEFAIDFCNIYQDAHEHLKYHFEKSHNNEVPLDILTIPNANTTKNLIPCEDFEYHSEYESVITTFDLVCSRDILAAVTQFFHLFGVLCGGCTATFMLNYINPRKVMLIGMITQIICGNLTGWVNIFELHMFFRCLSAVCCGLMYTAGAVIFCDLTRGKYKVSAVCLFEQFWSIGIMLLPLVSTFWSSWAQIYSAISFPTVILIYLYKWIPDSPRWLLKKGRIQEAKQILLDGAKMNGTLNKVDMNELDKLLEVQSNQLINEPKEPSYWTVWQGPNVKKNLICCHLCWSIYIIIYYGFLLNIRPFGREYLEINTVIAGICEIIGTFIGWYLIMYTTHKWFWSGVFNIITSFISLSALLIPSSVTGGYLVILLMMTSMSAKISISTTLSILTTCSTEFVTAEKKRKCGYEIIVWARIWLLAAPFVGATVVFGKLVPQTAMSIANIVGGILTAVIVSPRTIPETQNNSQKMEIPDSKGTKQQDPNTV